MASGKIIIHQCIQRFSDMDEELYKMQVPINGYEYMSFVSLAKAIERIVFILTAIPSYAHPGKLRFEELISSICLSVFIGEYQVETSYNRKSEDATEGSS